MLWFSLSPYSEPPSEFASCPFGTPSVRASACAHLRVRLRRDHARTGSEAQFASHIRASMHAWTATAVSARAHPGPAREGPMSRASHRGPSRQGGGGARHRLHLAPVLQLGRRQGLARVGRSRVSLRPRINLPLHLVHLCSAHCRSFPVLRLPPPPFCLPSTFCRLHRYSVQCVDSFKLHKRLVLIVASDAGHRGLPSQTRDWQNGNPMRRLGRVRKALTCASFRKNAG